MGKIFLKYNWDKLEDYVKQWISPICYILIRPFCLDDVIYSSLQFFSD